MLSSCATHNDTGLDYLPDVQPQPLPEPVYQEP